MNFVTYNACYLSHYKKTNITALYAAQMSLPVLKHDFLVLLKPLSETISRSSVRKDLFFLVASYTVVF